jgi:hypothetical protein
MYPLKNQQYPPRLSFLMYNTWWDTNVHNFVKIVLMEKKMDLIDSTSTLPLSATFFSPLCIQFPFSL